VNGAQDTGPGRNLHPLPGTAGGGLPARIWRDFMSEALGTRAVAPALSLAASDFTVI